MDALYILNVGEPVNSVQDDFSFIMDQKLKKDILHLVERVVSVVMISIVLQKQDL